ncbi:MAG TPA: hypothetical protein VFQ88_15295 [Nevskiaceae bacterium]|nr:hypothetical protein [Nevskiaceae bacterium]
MKHHTQSPLPVRHGIVQTTLQVTILHEAGDGIDGQSLANIADRMDSGDLIGAVTVTGVKPIAPERLKDALESIGNDGTFFDYLENA